MTSAATPKLRELAERLLAYEAALAAPAEDPGESSEGKSGPMAFRVCEKLRSPLTMLAGATGFQSLLLRALVLARREAPSLTRVQVQQEGLLDCESFEEDLRPEAEVLLVAHLVGLLIAFIGETLTLRLMQDAWPEGAFRSGNSEDSKRTFDKPSDSAAENGETQSPRRSADAQKARKPAEKKAKLTAEDR